MTLVKPVAVFGDVRAAALSALRDLLAARTEPYAAGAELGTRVPGDRSTDVPHLPYVLVVLDGTPTVQYPISAISALRVTVWHTSEEQAHDLAQLCMGLLLAYSGPVIARVRPGTGVLPSTDPDSGTPIASFTVAPHTRASVV